MRGRRSLAPTILHSCINQYSTQAIKSALQKAGLQAIQSAPPKAGPPHLAQLQHVLRCRPLQLLLLPPCLGLLGGQDVG